MQTPYTFLECFTLLDDVITKKELSICFSFLWFFKERLVGNHSFTFPEIEKIAKMSKCSTRTVNRFIKKYEGIIISHKATRNGKTGKNNPNQYHFNDDFFENMILLDACGYLKNWTKKTRIHVLKSYVDNEWFMHEILLCRGDLMNNEMSHGFYQKCRTIKNFFLLRKSIHKVLQEVPVINSKKEEKNYGIRDCGISYLNGLPLTMMQKRKLASNFGINQLKAAKEAFHYKNGSSNKIKNPENFLFMTCRNYTIQTIVRR